MTDRHDLEFVVTDWLRAAAPARAPERVLATTLVKVAGVGQARRFGRRPLDAWIGASPRLRWAVVLVVFAALLGAIAGVGALIRPPAPIPPSGMSNGWIAYSTAPHQSSSTSNTRWGSDIYLVRAGAAPILVAGPGADIAWNVCPVFSPDGRRLAFSAAIPGDGRDGRDIVVDGVDANGVASEIARIFVPGSGPVMCPRWSSDSTRLAYLVGGADGGVVVVRGMDGSTPHSVAGDPTIEDFSAPNPANGAILSPTGDRLAWLKLGVLTVASPDGADAQAIQLSRYPYAISAWSPDGAQVLLMTDVDGAHFSIQAVAAEIPFESITVVDDVPVINDRSWPGWADVSWQPLFP
jgi:Tol biopolymer transport system component